MEIKIIELTEIIHGILNGLLNQKYMITATPLKFKFRSPHYFIITQVIFGVLIFTEEMHKIMNIVFGRKPL